MGGTLLGWEKVMGSEYTKMGRSRASVNSPEELDAKVASIKEQVRNELIGEFNAWAKQMNLPLPFPSTTPVDSSSHPKRQGEDERHGEEEIHEVVTPTHADSREVDNPTPHEFPDLEVNLGFEGACRDQVYTSSLGAIKWRRVAVGGVW
ncbi:uncharacterized protein LOC110688894 [Chenopodium quinoa]|uniref:uncharacterized protein LOC110688894 n=1 Tax=Chenopodium quinoa TaxID=63459 RepID=UPI000B799FD2|nr:uncharacterized protein LOC110688894 [Chenopodium quinoa]